MQALFVHGMGRSPLSGWPLLRQLKRGGLSPTTFGYSTALENFEGIQRRLVSRIADIATDGDYVVIGHSLGGVLLRAAVRSLPPAIRRPHHLFILGSPIRSPRLARTLSSNLIYRAMTGDCGQLLGSGSRMAEIGPVAVPTTAIVGIRRLPWTRDPFAGELNDGVVSLSEVSAEWLSDLIQVHAVHTLLPSSRRVGEIILKKVALDAPDA
jgi:hypothetical protein